MADDSRAERDHRRAPQDHGRVGPDRRARGQGEPHRGGRDPHGNALRPGGESPPLVRDHGHEQEQVRYNTRSPQAGRFDHDRGRSRTPAPTHGLVHGDLGERDRLSSPFYFLLGQPCPLLNSIHDSFVS